ncbi:Outer membrane protein TolC [Pedobacter caeni]|uniref:Outer membrane protein TolC n=2 Tax=Pedobacter caeni TaxID=288992 RepID=A0A1M5NKA5_9SPHI|nr:Outer membrane protein TolC [Pedobacter caeni]
MIQFQLHTKMKTRKLLFVLLLLSGGSTGFAQQKLSLEEAISTALKNNYDIKLVNNEIQIAKNNINPGNAGMLPKLTADYSRGGSNQNTVQTQASGTERRTDGARSTNQSYGASLGWTIFDGFQMFANYDRLKELQKLGEVNAKGTVIATVADVINGYYALVRQQQLVLATDSALDISRMRLTIAKNKLEIGRGSKLDVLSATVDYNADTSLYLQQKNLLRTNMVTLNQVMARDLNLVFEVDQNMKIERDLNYTELSGLAQQLSPALQSAFINKKIAELSLKQVKGQRYPTVGLNSGYEFSNSTSPTGFNTQFRARGFTYGVTASLNLFNGFLQRQNERNAKVQINTTELNLEKAKQDINAQLLSAYQNYQTNLDLLKIEKNNVDIAKQNLDITLEKYRLGSISPLELREAQRNSITAITRYLDAQYQAKLTEISLKEISGTLNIQ